MTNVAQVPRSTELLAADGKSASDAALHLFNDLRFAALWLWASGTTAARPANPYLGQLYFDTTLGYIVECTAIGAPTAGTPATWTQLVPPAPAPNVVPLFDHFADVSTTGTGVTTLYSDTIAANQLVTNGDKLHAWYGGSTTATNTGTREWFMTFAGTNILDTTAQATSQQWSWSIVADIIRESSTVVRVLTVFNASKTNGNTTLMPIVKYTRITGLTLSGTNALILQGQPSVATNDITASMGSVVYTVA